MIGDFVYENCNAPGTGAITPAGAPTGRRTFAQAFGAGGKAYYVLDDGTQEEMGWTTVGATLTRNVIWTSVNGLTSTPINVTATARVYGYPPAERTMYADESSVWQAQGRRLTNLLAGVSGSDGLRWDQAGGIRVGAYSASGGNVTVPLPNGADLYEIEIYGLAGVVTAPMYFRVSIDGGATYLSGGTEFSYMNRSDVGAAATAGTAGSLSYGPLGVQNVSSTYGLYGLLKIYPAVRGFRADVHSFNGTLLTQETASGNWNTAGTPTHILISAVASSLSVGVGRLVRKA